MVQIVRLIRQDEHARLSSWEGERGSADTVQRSVIESFQVEHFTVHQWALLTAVHQKKQEISPVAAPNTIWW